MIHESILCRDRSDRGSGDAPSDIERGKRRRRTPRGTTLRSIAALALVFLAVTACSEDGGGTVSSLLEGGELPTTRPSDTEAPPETDAPLETEAPPDTAAPPATEAPADAGQVEEVSDDSNEDLLLLLLVLLIVALLGVAIWAAFRGRPQQQVDAGAAMSARVNQVIATGNWLHDSASLEVMRAPPEQVSQRWQNVRTRAVQLQTEAASLGMASGSQPRDAALSWLAQTLGSFIGAMDGYVSMYAAEFEQASADLQADARASVEARRRDLADAIAMLQAAR